MKEEREEERERGGRERAREEYKEKIDNSHRKKRGSKSQIDKGTKTILLKKLVRRRESYIRVKDESVFMLLE